MAGGWAGFAATFAVALAVRLAYVFTIRHTPLTDVLLIDSETYDRFARRILAGSFRGADVYSMNLLYPAFVAAVYRLAGAAPFAVLVVQAVLGAANAGLIHLLGRRFFDVPTAWVAGLAAAFYAPYVFYTGALLTPTLIDTFVLLALAALAAWRPSPRPGWLVLAGLATGLAALGRGNALLLIALVPVWFRVATGSWRRALRPWAWYAAGALALVGAATARNALVEGRFVPISANYAAFYLGHHERANGLYWMPDFVSTAAYEGEVTGARAALSREVGRELTQAEASGELFRRGLSWAAKHPRQELGLSARKLYYFWNRTESPTNLSFDFAREFSGLLRALPLHFGIVAPLGLAGMIAGRRRWRDWLPLGLVLVMVMVTCVLFFVSAEYRLPAAAVLILFAASALTRATRTVLAWTRPGASSPTDRPGRPARSARRVESRAAPRRRPAVRDGWIAAALLPLLVVACNIRTPLLRAQSANRVAFYNHGVLYKMRGEMDRAEILLRRSLAIDPNYAPALLALGQVEHQRGNGAEAARLIARARQSDASIAGPASDAPEDRLRVRAETLYQERRYEEAVAAFEQARDRYAALGKTESVVSVENNLGLALFKVGRVEEAERLLRRIITAQPRYVRAHTNLALVLESTGRAAEAQAEYRRALELEPDNRRARRALERLSGGGTAPSTLTTP